jgi:hypothetical protein
MKTFRLPKLNQLFEVMEIRGVKVFVHWSVLLIGAIILLGAFEEPWIAFAVLGAYYRVIMLHECGHIVAVQRKGCAMELYPLWESPASANLTLDTTTASSLGVVLWRGRSSQCRRLFGSKCSAIRDFRR